MSKVRKTYEVSAKEMVNIITKQWCCVDDFCLLSGTTRSTVYSLWNPIKTDLLKKKYLLPKGLLPMDEVVKALHIDVKKVVANAKMLDEVNLINSSIKN